MFNKLNQKRAQIGTTLTWFPSFLIIIFVMGLFILASSLFSNSGSAPDNSIHSPYSKNVNLGYDLSEPIGYDSGDFALKRELVAFLNSEVILQNSKVLVKDLVSSFDEDIYGSSRFSASERADHPKYGLFYNSTREFFDRTHEECYVVCAYFEKEEDQSKNIPANKQIIVGKNCDSHYESDYDCYVSNFYILNGIFNYAEVQLPSNNLEYNPTKIKMLKGNITGHYSGYDSEGVIV